MTDTARLLFVIVAGDLPGASIMGSQGDADRGMVRLASHHPVAETIERLESLLRARGVAVFARIDFAADAQRAGLSMRPEQLLVFGNPKAGTPLMVAAPSAGIDLPFKVVAWEDAEGRAWLAYNSPDHIVNRHGLDCTFATNLAALVPLIERAANS
jgi:uncharacterized protein (DUF302 family)